ncbi:hypothetical protein GXB85_04060 [Cellulomonas sp. APG4]|nr:hypothetical protein [Cellulomonas sp. APG4]
MTVVLDRMGEEIERYGDFPFLPREQARPWLFMALLHSHAGEFRFGRMTRLHEFVEVEAGELGQLFSLDAYRGGEG